MITTHTSVLGAAWLLCFAFWTTGAHILLGHVPVWIEPIDGACTMLMALMIRFAVTLEAK